MANRVDNHLTLLTPDKPILKEAKVAVTAILGSLYRLQVIKR